MTHIKSHQKVKDESKKDETHTITFLCQIGLIQWIIYLSVKVD